MKLDNFVPFGRPQSSTLITQLITKLDVSNKLIPEQKYQTHLESKEKCLFLRPKIACHITHFSKIYNRQVFK